MFSSEKHMQKYVINNYILFLIALFLFFLLYPGKLQQESLTLSPGESVNVSVSNPFLSHFIKIDPSPLITIENQKITAKKYGKDTLSIQVMFFSYSCNLLVTGFIHEEEMYMVGDTFQLDLMENENAVYDIPDGIVLDSQNYIHCNTAGTYIIKCKNRGKILTKKLNILYYPNNLVLEKGKRYHLPFADIGWKSTKKAIIINNQIFAKEDGETILKDEKGHQIKVNIIYLSPEYILYKGESIDIQSFPKNTNWTCQQPEILSIDTNYITAKKTGQTFVQGTAGSIDVKSNITVVSLKKQINLPVGETYSLDLKGTKEEHWSVKDPEIAIVSKKGKVQSQKEGNTQINASIKARTFSCNLTVFKIEETSFILAKGDETQIHCSLDQIKYSSENDSIVKVDDTGKIKAVGYGKTNIICDYGNGQKKIPVNVLSITGGDDYADITIDNNIRSLSYRIFKQHSHKYAKYNHFLACNGCATCSVTSVLRAYSEKYKDLTPDTLIDGIEKEVAGEVLWNSHHKNGKDVSVMPLSLNGINRILQYAQVKTEYVRSFKDEEAKNDIISHLKTGNAVIIEVRKKDRYTGKLSKKWTNSVHTLVLLGVMDGETVLVGDPANRNGGSGSGRIKKTTFDDLFRFMWSCTSTTNGMYYEGQDSDGGYIKILSKEN